MIPLSYWLFTTMLLYYVVFLFCYGLRHLMCDHLWWKWVDMICCCCRQVICVEGQFACKWLDIAISKEGWSMLLPLVNQSCVEVKTSFWFLGHCTIEVKMSGEIKKFATISSVWKYFALYFTNPYTAHIIYEQIF